MPSKAAARAPDSEQTPNLARRQTAPIGTPGSAPYRSQTGSAKIYSLSRKVRGGYYTPDDVAASLTRWAVRRSNDRMLDPACGDGRFIVHHPNSVGIEQDLTAARQAAHRASAAIIHQTDFFEWAASTGERFDCAAGNPPFIRYQRFKGTVREQALSLCAGLGASFSGLTSSWAPFLVAAASLLRPGGRMAFVVPAEIGHAPYAAPLLEYLVTRFATVHVIAVRKKVFPELSVDCWLLYLDGFGQKTNQIRFTALETFRPIASVPPADFCVSINEWRNAWNRRLRPLLLPSKTRELYQKIAARPETRRLGELASIGIGYVSGGNNFFHLRPSEAERACLPSSVLRPTLRNGRYLPPERLTAATVEAWQRADEPVLLLQIPRNAGPLPRSVTHYLETDEAAQIRLGYKCRNRHPWYSIPDVRVPDFFLSYLSGISSSLVRNEAGITCTNALHYVRLKNPQSADRLAVAWRSSFTQLSCEIEGHPLGGGVLKLEPREASAVLLIPPDSPFVLHGSGIAEAISVMRSWRHYC